MKKNKQTKSWSSEKNHHVKYLKQSQCGSSDKENGVQ